MKKTIKTILMSVAIGALATVVPAQIATGGTYGLDQQVVGNGGGDSSGGTYAARGTSGQTTAGVNSTGGSYAARGGFWAPNLLAPSAGSGTISGVVLMPGGGFAKNVFVTLTGGSMITPRTTRTNSFGNFAFGDVEVGQIYTVEVSSKRLGFPQPTYALSLFDNVTDIVFQAGWEN